VEVTEIYVKQQCNVIVGLLLNT